MGFFSDITQAMFDPAGSAVRQISGNDERNARSFIDPSGKLIQRPDNTAAPVLRPRYVSHLSPAAQALKDQIAARHQAQMGPPAAGVSRGPAQAITGDSAPSRFVRPPTQTSAQVPMMGTPGIPGQVPQMQATAPLIGYYRDGGQVKKGSTNGKALSKIVNRKPNGKPY